MRLKGFAEPDRAVPGPAGARTERPAVGRYTRRMDQDPDRLLERVRAGGLLPAGASGPRAALRRARLDLPARRRACAWRARRSSRPCTSTTGCARGRRRRALVRGAVRAARRARWTVERARAPDGAGNLQAWARDVRYGAAARRALARGARVAAGHTATDQAETVLYRLAASPGRRRCWACRRATGCSCARCSRSRARRPRRTAAPAAWPGARTPSNELGSSPIRARACAHETAAGAARRSTRRPRPTSCARRRSCATRPTCSTRSSTRCSRAATGSRLRRLAALPPALRRLVARRLAEDAAGRPVPEAAGAAPTSWWRWRARRARPSLDLGGGLRGGGRVRRAALRRRAAASRAPRDGASWRCPERSASAAWDVRCEPAAAEPAGGRARRRRPGRRPDRPGLAPRRPHGAARPRRHSPALRPVRRPPRSARAAARRCRWSRRRARSPGSRASPWATAFASPPPLAEPCA